MRSNPVKYLAAALVLVLSAACGREAGPAGAGRTRPLAPESPTARKLAVEAALEQTSYTFYYDPAYVRIGYPGGDVSPERGVCTDVIVRAFRKAGVDLQREVHEDMLRAFAAYPTRWGMKRPDPNIDHRRVPNLRTFFERKGKALAVTHMADDYLPGDVVTWDIGGGVDHTGMVTNVWSDSTERYMIVHNIGAGVKVEDVVFAWRITGHYRYF